MDYNQEQNPNSIKTNSNYQIQLHLNKICMLILDLSLLKV